MDSSDVQNTHRNKHSKSDNVVNEEIQKLLRKNNEKTSSDLINKLKSRLGDDELVNKIQQKYVEVHSSIVKKARKFARLIREKYGDSRYPFHILLEKAHMFKVKHGLSNDEFAEFQKIYEQELVGLQSPEVFAYANNMMKLLGTSQNSNGFTGKLNDQDYKYLQEIVKLSSTSKVLHSQVFLQSVQYNDCAFQALTGTYDRARDNPLEHIHPVIAALFLPKVEELEHNFILANMANIVKARFNKEPIANLPDAKLFHALISDPNDIVCDARSSVLDLLNRCNLQQQLWNCVLNLRNGQYYGSGFRDFISGVDMCKLNKYDNPDLVYGRYDGTVVKRLLSSFSFRPTMLASSTINPNNFSTNPYTQNMRPVVSAVPMINLRLAPNINNNNAMVSLSDALQQDQVLVENGMIVSKQTSLLFSNDVLFFYVDRRANSIRLEELKPYNIGKMPVSISGFERLNDQEVEFKEELTIRSDLYKLRSVVLSEVNEISQNTKDQNIVVGSSAVIIAQGNDYETPDYLYYNPLGVVKGFETDGAPQRNNPITLIPMGPQVGGYEEASFLNMAKKRGIIFMYQLVKAEEKERVLNF
jgi:hypothetical protein